MRVFICIVGFMMGFDVEAMDIVKTLKVTEQPNTFWHRKMDQAIKVQMSDNPMSQYLKKRAHPCCRFY